MFNAYETTIRALRTMAPFICHVHVRGGKRVIEKEGWGQLDLMFKSYGDQVPAERLFFELLLLSSQVPQVNAFILEQEVGYCSPPFRQPDESKNPFIPHRNPSETAHPDNVDIDRLCLDERRLATQMLWKVLEMLTEIKCAAKASLYNPEKGIWP
jgi:hypothetical protein